MKKFILSHKLISIVVLVVIVASSYFIFKGNKSTESRYITDTVKVADISNTITGTGQVEAKDTIDLKTKTSGDINYIGVSVGQVISKGKLIASVDSRDAKLALESAKLSLEKLVGDPDALTLLQKENSLTKSYNDGWNNVSSFITNANSIIDEIDSLYDYNTGFLGYKNTKNLSSVGRDKVNTSYDNYYTVKKSVDDLSKSYKSLSRTSPNEDISALIVKAYDTSKLLSSAVKDTEGVFKYVIDYLDLQNNSDAENTRSDINSWSSDSNSYVSTFLSTTNSIQENEQSFADFIAGADDIDIREAELNVESKQQAYNDCFVYAPFDGTIATLTAKVGESSGSSIGTLITNQKLATISLNEVDIAKIELGQKVNLTFDAIEDLNITGKVAEIDSLGTVSQGVVSYDIKISFDVDDSRIKPGMSVDATIITETASDVLSVPNSAIKSFNGNSYVEVLDSSVLPSRVSVATGLTDDTRTEITSGLKEGDVIVVKTITGATAQSTKSTTPSLLNAVGGSSRGSASAGADRVFIRN